MQVLYSARRAMPPEGRVAAHSLSIPPHTAVHYLGCQVERSDQGVEGGDVQPATVGNPQLAL